MAECIFAKNSLYHLNGIIRVLEVAEDSCLCIDCIRQTIPKWMPFSDFENASACGEDELPPIRALDSLGAEERKVAQERYTLIAGILPNLGNSKARAEAIRQSAQENSLSRKTITNYLCAYLSYQSIAVLAPAQAKEKELSKDEKNIRWALNKFYYTRHGNTLADAFTMMLKERYTDTSGALLPEHPSIHQFRYFYRCHKSLQKEYISRDGIKSYEMNSRPLLGDGVQQFASAVGTGMLDATVCDIYLCDDAGNVVGRPVLVACVDGYSGMVCGYSLLWEGGMYSIRELLLNCISAKREWCKQFGILIEDKDWACSELPGTLVTDMGGEFTSYNLEQIADLGCKIINLPAFRAELKGPVEQIFNLAQNLYKPYLKGKGVIEADYQKRGAHDYRKDACLTMEQFEQIIIRCVLYYNNNRVVENFPYTEEMLASEVQPHASDIWNFGKVSAGANLIKVSKEQLVLTLLPRAEGKFTRVGLKVNRLRYKADGYTEQFLKGGPALVAYNPDDVSCVWLIENGEYIQFDLIENRFLDMPLSKVEDIQQRQKAIVKACEEDTTRARVELAQHIEAITAQAQYHSDVNMKGIRASRQRQRNRRHKDLMQEVQHG